jgi:dolichyl-phosphate-mannose-protein mannosyltransferase
MRARHATAVALALAAIGSLLAFGAVGREFYADFRLPQGSGMYHLLAEELAFYWNVFLFGGLAWAALWAVLRVTTVPAALVETARRLAPRGTIVAGVTAAAVFATCALVSSQVLGRAVTCDDEHVYRLIAQTLRTGSLTSPSPGADLQFFREQFVLLTETARYGKYPIGHPLLLAIGQALGADWLVVPATTGMLALVVHAIGRVTAGSTAALVAVALFALSPQVLLTGATYLSQPPAALLTAGAVACLLAAERRAPGSSRWIVAAGVLLGYSFLVRPLPTVLFVPVAAAYVAWDGGRLDLRRAAGRLALLGAPIVAALAVLAVVNRAQAGSAFVTAYGQAIAPDQGARAILLTTVATPAMRIESVMGSVTRLNFWLFGWPLSLALCAFAAWSRPVALMWGLVAAEVAYRVLTPKVGVGGTGPIYFFEVVPLLCVLSAAGAARLARRAGGGLGSPDSIAAFLVAGAVVGISFFLPSRVMDLGRMGAAQRAVDVLVHDQGVSHALVFHEGTVPWWTRRSWAYYPRCNSPSLDDDVLFILFQRQRGLDENVEFWKRRYPSRTAWYYGYKDGRPALMPLMDFLRMGGTIGPPP